MSAEPTTFNNKWNDISIDTTCSISSFVATSVLLRIDGVYIFQNFFQTSHFSM